MHGKHKNHYFYHSAIGTKWNLWIHWFKAVAFLDFLELRGGGEDMYTDPGTAYFLFRYFNMEKGKTREKGKKKKHAIYKWYNSAVCHTFNK